MLSKAEVEFLRGEKQVSGGYRRKIRERIRTKFQSLRDELAVIASDPEIGPILEEALSQPSVMEIRHVTGNCHAEFPKIDVLRAGLSSSRDFEPAILGSKGRYV